MQDHIDQENEGLESITTQVIKSTIVEVEEPLNY